MRPCLHSSMVIMKIYVCVKHVPDSAASIHLIGNGQIDERITFLMNPYDEHAVTAAADLKKTHAGSEVIAVCMGKAAAEATVRSAMAMGADRGILIVNDPAADSMLTARALHAAIAADGAPDIILAGKEAIDSEGMQTHFRLAGHFEMPAAVNAVAVKIADGAATVTCERDAGAQEIVRMQLPCVIGAGRGLNTPRYPTLPDIVKSRKKPVKQIALADLALPEPAGRMTLIDLQPAAEPRTPQQLSGSAEQIAHQIITILREQAKVI